jgi:hypothetical protein
MVADECLMERAELLALMPKLVAVTPEEMDTAGRIAAHLRASACVRSALEAPGCSNAAHLVVGVSLPAGDLYYLLTWLDNMAGG